MQSHNSQNHQCINCTVNSCKYNNQIQHRCTLESINVRPTPGVSDTGTDESMCGSYQH